MAKVFLSYDRDDTERARQVALALEKAGHSVWWDSHIRGGEQFSKAIEEALEAANVVIVLWSSNSIESAWVRDEAAAGRDSNRLVPATIDGTGPPLGFRQFQTIDLSDWTPRGEPAQLHTLLADIELTLQDRTGRLGQPHVKKGEVERTFTHQDPRRRITVRAMVIVIGLLIFISGLMIARPWSAGASLPAVAVVSTNPSARGNELAQNLLVKLNILESARSGSMRLIGEGLDNAGDADLIFQVSANDSGNPSASLMLMSRSDRSVMWSGDFQASSLNDLKQQASFTAARVLGCALEGLSSVRVRLEQATFKAYLNACALLGETFFDDTSQAVTILRHVTTASPKFRPGWAKLLVAETNRYQGMSPVERKANAAGFRRLISEARRLHPGIPEADVAEIELLPGRDFYDQVRLIDRASRAEPNNVFVLAARSLVMLCVGRMEAAVEDARQAADLDPLSPAMRSSYLQALIYSGRTDAARSELAEAGRLWPDAGTILDARYRLDARYGDRAEALQALELMQSGKVEAGRTLDAFVRARIDPTPPNITRATDLAVSAYRTAPDANTVAELILTLGEFDRTEDLLEFLLVANDESQFPYFVEALFRPQQEDLRADPRFIQVSAHLGLLDYWKRSGDWPDFCSDPALPYDCKKEAAKLKA